VGLAAEINKNVKLSKLSSLGEHGSRSSSIVLGLHECGSGSGVLFFHNMAPAPTQASVGFCTFIFSIVLVRLK